MRESKDLMQANLNPSASEKYSPSFNLLLMKTILILIFCLIFIETNGQNGVAIKQRIQDIEIRGKATTITTKGSTTCHGYGDYMNDEIVFVDEGEEHIYIDSVTIVDLQKAYSIISSNMLTGFYGDIKIDFHPEFSGLIEGNIYFDSEEIERISSSITLPSEQFDFNKSQIALFDSTTMAFMIGSQFARLCFAVATKNDTYSQQNYYELEQMGRISKCRTLKKHTLAEVENPTRRWVY
jgi:hypothetical protein